MGLIVFGNPPLYPSGLYFIVTAPKAQRSVISQPQNLVFKLCGNGFSKFVCQQIGRAGKHKVLPDDDAVFVTPVIKGFRCVMTAAPNPQEVVIGLLAILQQADGFIWRYANQNLIFRNIIGTHGKKLYAVVDKAKFFAKSIFFLGNGQSPQANAGAVKIGHKIFFGSLHWRRNFQCSRAGIQRLFAQASNPPKFGVCNRQSAGGTAVFYGNGGASYFFAIRREKYKFDDCSFSVQKIKNLRIGCAV